MAERKSKKISLTLSERDLLMLNQYAENQCITRGVAIKRLLRENLRNHAADLKNNAPKNQLDIFDSVQIDIFDSAAPVGV